MDKAIFAWHLSQYQSIFEERGGKVCGEISPDYVLLEDAQVARFAEHYPDVRIIYLVRNIIEMTFSQAKLHYFNQKGLEALPGITLEEYVKVFQWKAVLARNDIVGTIKRWQSHFDPEQIIMLSYDDIVHNPRTLLEKCLMHIGSGDWPWFETIPDSFLKLRRNNIADLPIPPEVRDYLIGLYRERIGEIGEFLHQDLSHWLEKPATASPSRDIAVPNTAEEGNA